MIKETRGEIRKKQGIGGVINEAEKKTDGAVLEAGII